MNRSMNGPRAARGGLFQDDAFVFSDLEGATLEQLVAYVDAADVPSIVFLKASGHHWQRCFLDAGLGFWGEYDDDEVADELEDVRTVDYGGVFGIVGQQLGQVTCEPGPRIRVALSSGDFILETSDESVLDAPSRVRFQPRSGA